METFLVKVRQILPDLNQTERKIANYILENPYDIMNFPIYQLAQRTGVSEAAWVRFGKTLGFSGFKEVRREIGASGLVQNRNKIAEDDTYSDVKGDDPIDIICKKVYAGNIKSIMDTKKILDIKELEKAVKVICVSEKIAFYGVGASGLVAADAHCKFSRIGLNSMSFSDLHMQITSAVTLGKADAAVIISYSGMSKDVIEVMDIAKSSGATIIGITKYGKNTISQNADIMLYTCSPEITMRSGAMGSRIAQLTAIDILFTCVANKLYGQIEHLLKETRKYTEIRKV